MSSLNSDYIKLVVVAVENRHLGICVVQNPFLNYFFSSSLSIIYMLENFQDFCKIAKNITVVKEFKI